MKLYVAMVGVPARGKSTLAKRIRSGLEQQGIRTAIFNNGELRRMLFGLESGSAEFFNPDNTRAQRLRDQITHQNMERARAWLDEGGDVAIIDATNGTVHQRVDLSATLRDRPVLFIECVNDDPLLLDASIRRKTRLPEFANMTQEEALESLTPIVREAVKRLGFREICLDENQDAVRAHFFKIYSTLIERKTNDAKLPPSILEAKNKYIAQLTTHENAAIEQQHRDQIAEEPERATPEYIDMLMREHGFKR